MNKIHRIKCGNGNCYVIENGANGILVDKSNTSQQLYAATFLGKIVLSASLRDFSTRPITEFKPDILMKDGDNLLEYGMNAQVFALPGHTDGSIGIDVENEGLIVGDALMNMFYPTVSMLYHNRNQMLESAGKISNLGNRTIYFGHGRPVDFTP